MQSELQYNEFLIARFKEYKTFMKKSGRELANDKELIKMDIDSLKEEKTVLMESVNNNKHR